MNLSIIIPIYNAEKYIDAMLNSIINQKVSEKEYEVILINDGSVDNSKNICENYVNKYSNIKLINIDNSGSGIARNKGIENALGKYLYFPDSDDILEQGSLEKILDDINTTSYDLYVYSFYEQERTKEKKIQFIIKDKVIQNDKFKDNYYLHMCEGDEYIQGAPWNKVFKKEIVDKYNIRYQSLKRHQDEAFIFQYINYVNNIKFSSKPIYIYYTNNLYQESLKFPKNYYDIRKDLYIYESNIIEKWKNNKLTKLYIDSQFLFAINRCFKLTFTNKWNMLKHERKTYIKNILNDKTVLDVLENIKLNKDDVWNMYANLNVSKIKIMYYKLYIMIVKYRMDRIIYIYNYLINKVRKA